MNEIVLKDAADAIMEQVIAKGDLKNLTSDERNKFYLETCHSLGLNPLTRPFEYTTLSGQLRLYANRSCADQLRRIYGVEIQIIRQERQGDLYLVTVHATDKTGRGDEDVGVVAMPKSGAEEIKANLIMKAITKAKRRVTLSICGLGFLDETEVEDIVDHPKKKSRVTTVTSADAPQMIQESPPTGHGNTPEATTAASPTTPPQTSPPGDEAADLTAESYEARWDDLIKSSTDAETLRAQWNDEKEKEIRSTIKWPTGTKIALQKRVTKAIEFLKEAV